eukprot:9944656-Alexandrium_andersonii.AAC.1
MRQTLQPLQPPPALPAPAPVLVQALPPAPAHAPQAAQQGPLLPQYVMPTGANSSAIAFPPAPTIPGLCEGQVTEGIRAGEVVSEYDARGRLRLMPTPEELVILRQVHPQ